MIETERLILRHVRKEDAEDIFEYAKDSDVGPRAGWEPHRTIEDTRALLASWTAPDLVGEQFAVVYRPDNKVVGTMGVLQLNLRKKDSGNKFVNNLIESGKKVYEIGNAIAKPYWGRGLSTECLKEMTNYLFETTDADVVITTHYSENKASGRVQEKCGMKILGTYQREQAWFNTLDKTMVVRGKTREEWEEELEFTY